MAFKIKKQDQKNIESTLESLAISRRALEAAVATFNEELTTARAKLQEAVDHHNELAETVRGQIEDIHREMSEEFDNKSDKWQEGEKAEAVREWLDAVESMGNDLEDAAIDSLPESLEMDDVISTDPSEAWAELDKEPQ